MNKNTLDDLIRAEVAHAKAHEDDPLPAGIRVTRPNRGTVLSVRLDSDDFDLLTRQAAEDGLPVSTQARVLIVAGLRQPDTKTLVTQALRETLRPDLIAA